MINPMLCGSITENELKGYDRDIWKANIKYDGERILALKKGTDVFLLNRRGKEKSFVYPEVSEELAKIKEDFILDGEVITEDFLFNSLQHRAGLTKKDKIEQAKEVYPVIFMAFDIISLNGENLCSLPLKTRISHLNFIDEEFKHLGFVAYEEIDECLEYAKTHNCEGIIIKNMNSIYEQKRTNTWLKMKLFLEDVLIAVSYTINPKGIRIETKDKIACQIAGEQHKEVKRRIDEKGECEIIIQYLSKTNDNMLRFPSYRGLAK